MRRDVRERNAHETVQQSGSGYPPALRRTCSAACAEPHGRFVANAIRRNLMRNNGLTITSSLLVAGLGLWPKPAWAQGQPPAAPPPAAPPPAAPPPAAPAPVAPAPAAPAPAAAPPITEAPPPVTTAPAPDPMAPAPLAAT